jgi:hypothetical protein
MPSFSRSLALLCVVGAASASLLRATEPVPPPRPWGPDPFLPVSEARIAALPMAEQPAWRAYWQASVALGRPPEKDIDPVENRDKPLANRAPIPAVFSTRLQLNAEPAWYASPEARSIADHIALWQRPSGGWTKGGDYTRAPRAGDDHHNGWSAGTFDNDSTIYELRFLALVNQAGESEPRAARWRESFIRGLDYVFAAQYPNGGFPQIYPLVGSYHDAITLNDDAMVHILDLLRDVAERKPVYGFVPAAKSVAAAERVSRGIACVLAMQATAR